MNLLVSCISTQHSTLKQHWTTTREEIACPITVLGSYQKPEDGQQGLLCLLDDKGRPQKMLEMLTPAGMVHTSKGIFVATPSSIHEIGHDLSVKRHDAVSLPLFNLLHSLSRTQRGYLAASTGTDTIIEFDEDGQQLWSWCALDHGFTLTPTGEERELDLLADHRQTKYGTLTQTTHINSAAELPDGTILASLFHQGMIIAIDRASGNWHTVLEGLDHPHAIRILDAHHITLADTVRGLALMVSLDADGKGHIESEVFADTEWLQDCQYSIDYDRWILVDGKNSRVTVKSGPSGSKTLFQFDLNPEWRLYEALVV
jgi:hypothetical protein